MKKKILCTLLVCTMAILTACGASGDSSKSESAESSSEDAGADASVEEDTDEDDTESAGVEAALYNQDNIEITAQLTESMESDWELNLVINNQSDKNISIGVTELKTNDILADGCEMFGTFDFGGQPDLQQMLAQGFSIAEVAAGDTQTAEDVTYALEKSNLEERSITSLEKINITLGIFDTDTKELLCQTDSVEIPVQ